MSGVERTAGREHIVDQQQLSIRDWDAGDQANVGGSLLPLGGAALLHVILRLFQQLHDRQPQSGKQLGNRIEAAFFRLARDEGIGTSVK